MGHVRKNFSDAVKAQAFARDRATCCYSGRNLWAADFGAIFDFPVEWCDHFVPSAEGGSAELSNARSAHWEVNYDSGAGDRPLSLCVNGKLFKTAHVTALERVDVESRLKRMEKIDASDWYLNRAFINILWGVEWLCHNGRHRWVKGRSLQEPVKRMVHGDRYRARAALRFLKNWRSATRRAAVEAPELRGLYPVGATEDVRILWSSTACADEPQMLGLMSALEPFMRANWDESMPPLDVELML
jgi:hypothetical protein